MKYQTRSNLQSQLEANNPIEEFTFVKKHLTKRNQSSSKLQDWSSSRQLSSSDQTRSSQNKLRQSLGQGKSRKVEKSTFVSSRALGERECEKLQSLQNSQLVYRRPNNSRSNYPKGEMAIYERHQQTSDQIHREIIRILQMENKNLKEQNQFFISEHKKIFTENSSLKAQIQQLQTNNALHLQIQKLTNLNQAYQNQLEELKYILLQEVSAIHQKLNSCMSSEQASSIYNDINDSFKISVSEINFNRQSFSNKMNGRQLSANNDFGAMLSQMLELDVNDTFQKSPEKTVQTIDKERNKDYLNLDLNFIESPSETTFSGNVRLSQ